MLMFFTRGSRKSVNEKKSKNDDSADPKLFVVLQSNYKILTLIEKSIIFTRNMKIYKMGLAIDHIKHFNR